MSNYKRLFLEQYQYIFITIVTHNRNPILVENIETLKAKELVLKYYNGITTTNSDNIDIDASIKDKGGVETVIYHTLEEVPEWAKTQVKWFIDNGYLQGNGKGDLNISYDFLRTLIILYRVITDKE